MTAPRQPFLHDEFVTLRAPNQVWSDRDGRIGRHGVHGYWTGDQRVVSAISVQVVGSDVEPVATVPESASATVFTAMLRGFDGPGADPDVRLDRRLVVRADGIAESARITSRLGESREVELVVRIRPDAAGMESVRAGGGPVATSFDIAEGGASGWSGAVGGAFGVAGGGVSGWSGPVGGAFGVAGGGAERERGFAEGVASWRSGAVAVTLVAP
ncbi:MAG TPA: glycogen debranching N-terminal domain-containing protein, partial [Pseudonocardiaceae bacterium]|nr:glycogen debranching N-terminal domain-containing protein [Pseudonocardiaceae bacterium]